MSKELKVIIIDKEHIRLEENGEIGDIINLKTIKNVDLSLIEELINQSKDNIYEKKIKEIKEQSEKDFENYCFVYKPSEFEIAAGQNVYIEVSYTFYDKKFKKGNNELYTFYMTKNIERLKISDNKIVFPHIGFVHLRKAIEEKNIKEAKYF